jgi:hypothetical protein
MQTGMAAAAAGDCGQVTTENGLWAKGRGEGGAAIDTGSTARVQRGEGWSPDLGQQLSTIRGRERERELAPTEISPPPPLLCEKRGGKG